MFKKKKKKLAKRKPDLDFRDDVHDPFINYIGVGMNTIQSEFSKTFSNKYFNTCIMKAGVSASAEIFRIGISHKRLYVINGTQMILKADFAA